MKKILLTLFLILISSKSFALTGPTSIRFGCREQNYCFNYIGYNDFDCTMTSCGQEAVGNCYCQAESNCTNGYHADPNEIGEINDGGGSYYLYATPLSTSLINHNPEGRIVDGTRWMSEAHPTFCFNAVEADAIANTTVVYFSLDIDSDSSFATPDLTAHSGAKLVDTGTGDLDHDSVDWQYTIPAGSELYSWSNDKTYYWRVKACSGSDYTTGCTNYLISGGDPTLVSAPGYRYANDF
jgi:hypothetical protein